MTGENDPGKMLEIAGMAARIILENGAETYRVEDTVLRMCRSYGFEGAEVLALSTGVFVTVGASGQNGAAIRRVRKRGINLSRVNEVNDLSRQIAMGQVEMDQALTKLKEIQSRKGIPAWQAVLISGLVTASFALMLGGHVPELCVAAVCALVTQTALHWLRREDISVMMSSLIGGFLCSAVTMAGYYLLGLTPAGVGTALAGAIMPLISGLMMTNAVRDSLRGDLLSGLARGFEALLVAIMVALGISLLLGVYLPGDTDAVFAAPPWGLAVLYAGLGTLLFCPLLNTPKRAALPASLLGAAAYAGFLLLQDVLGMGQTSALFVASAVIAVLCESLARRMRMIATVFLCVALIPLVPGLGLYKTMQGLLFGQYEKAMELLLNTLFAVGAIALGAAIGSLPMRRSEVTNTGS